MKKEERRKKTEERRKKNEVVSSGSELKTEKEKEKELVPGRAERTPDVSGEHALRHVKATSMKGICGVEAEGFQPHRDWNLGTGTYCTGALQSWTKVVSSPKSQGFNVQPSRNLCFQ